MKKNLSIILIILFALLFIFFNIKNSNNNSVLIENNDYLSFSNKEVCELVANNLSLPLQDVLVVAHISDISQKIILKNNKPIDMELFNRLLNIAKQKEYVLYNANTNKYHKLDCFYGLKSKSYNIIEKKDLPKDATPCKNCFVQKTMEKIKFFFPLKVSTKNIILMLSDMSANLKPSRECKTNICKGIVSEINSAKHSIDIAIYGYDRVPAIEFALLNAIKRGVKVRLVYDTNTNNENIYKDTNYLTTIIKNSKNDMNNVDSKYTNSIMHNKFYIFDSQKVITGSANLSFTDMSGFNSNSVLFIYSPAIAKIYENEFNQMYSGKFHNLKSNLNNKTNIVLGDSEISVYFSPQNNTINNTIIPLINSAKKYIYIPTFLITDKNFANSLILARKRGVDVKVIIDAVNAKSKSSKHKLLRDNGILVKTENFAGKLHSKSIIIDDKYLIIGSMNFSYSGNYKNDENDILIKNSKLASFYRNFFEYLWLKIPDFWLNHDVSAESKYSTGSCSDGIDNDYDGKIDMYDEGCKIN